MRKVDYAILQLPSGTRTERLCTFFDLPEDITVKEIQESHQVVWGEKLEVEDSKSDLSICEKLFKIFNTQHPTGYRARSLSVSDVVRLDGRYYACDSFGFREVM